MRLFLGGVPTTPDVDNLMKKFEIHPGARISYQDVQNVIGNVNEYRFRTITHAWRKRVFREKLIQSIAGGGIFCFLTADEAHDSCKRGVQKIGRATGRLTVHVEAVDTNSLTSERRDQHNILRREAQMMLESIRKSAKTIAGPKPVDSRLRLAK